MLGGPTMNLVIYIRAHDPAAERAGARRTRPPRSTRSPQCVVPANSARRGRTISGPATATEVTGLRPPACSPATRSRRSNSTHIGTWNDAVKIIEASAGQHLTMTVRRDGKDLILPITPVKKPEVRQR